MIIINRERNAGTVATTDTVTGDLLPRWGTADAEIKGATAENPQLVSFLPGVSQNIFACGREFYLSDC